MAPLLGLVPMRVRPVVYAVPAGAETVSCGTVFAPSRWAGDDACEALGLGRTGLIFMGLIVAVAAAAVALTLFALEKR